MCVWLRGVNENGGGAGAGVAGVCPYEEWKTVGGMGSEQGHRCANEVMICKGDGYGEDGKGARKATESQSVRVWADAGCAGWCGCVCGVWRVVVGARCPGMGREGEGGAIRGMKVQTV